MPIHRNLKAPSGLFSADLSTFFSRIDYYAPSETGQISSKIDRPCFNIFCGTGSKIL